MTCPWTLCLIRVEGDARAVRRPRRTPRLELPFRDLHRVAAGRRHHVEMIPAVAVADDRKPLAIRRRQQSRTGITGDAPEFFVDVFSRDARRAGCDVGD